MAIQFTPEQQKVIETRGCNLLVSAAAGSGKTAVLVERIVHMVCSRENPVDIDRLLIVTFTNAAASEMRERIGAALLKRLEEEPENEHLQKQITLLHNAQITTIHSFCLFILRNNFNDIGLDPAFRIGDEGELELLRQEVLGQMLEERFASGDQEFYHCVEVYCPNGRESVLEGHILDLYDFSMSYPWPEEWLAERKKDYGDRSADEEIDSWYSQEWARYLKEHIHRALTGCLEKMNQVRELCERPDGPYMYGALAEEEIKKIENLVSMDSLEKLSWALSGIAFSRLPSKKDDTVSPEKRELAKNLRNEVKACLNDLQERFFTTPLELARKQMGECGRALDVLLDLCLELKERMDGAKREKNLLDFSDLEHFALNVLLLRTDEGVVPTKTALEYREYFTEVLIDEYQDSNLVQEYLLRAVSGEDEGNFNRFMVGDVKQSIYKFRLARPELFLEKYHTYSLGGGNCRRIDLHKNFRSRREVVEAVNQVFEKTMNEELGGLVYDESAALRVGAVYSENEGSESELLLMEKPPKEENISAKTMEAMGIARKIKELLGSFKVTDKETGQLRPVRYKDIVILLRTNSGWDEEFKKVFEQEDIPVHITSRTGYFSTSEIQNIIQFLRVLDNPLQDIPLFGTLKSVFGGFSDEEVARIRSTMEEYGKENLYDSLRQYAGLQKEGEEQAEQQKEQVIYLREKCRNFLQRLDTYRTYTSYMPIRSLIQKLCSEHGYLYYVAALPAGEQRLANVEMLLEKAGDFEKTSYYGLFHFIRYMERLEKYQMDYGEASLLGDNADVVRLMSIHKSKGLEFPVVFVAGLSKRFNMQDTNQAVIVDMDMGIGTDYVDPERRIRNKSLRKTVLAEKMKHDNLAEEIRIFYVALTRAKEKLIMTGVLEKAEEKVKDYALLREGQKPNAPLSYLTLVSASSYLDLMLPVREPSCIWKLEDLAEKELADAIDQEGRKLSLAGSAGYVKKELEERIHQRFSYRYPHRNLAGLYTKTTVSELKMAAMAEQDEAAHHMFEEKEIVPYIPPFMRGEERVSGTARGNAFHKVMELLDFSDRERFISLAEEEQEKDMEARVSKLCGAGRLSTEYAEAISIGKLCGFFRSRLAERMENAAKKECLYREQPFVYGISASRLSPKIKESPDSQSMEFPEEETVLIQGIIDVFFEEAGEIVLVDYKTDRVSGPLELSERYRVQLDYYQEAISRLTGKRVKERILYSFSLGCEIIV